MLRSILLAVILVLPQLGCDAEYGEDLYPYERGHLDDEARVRIEAKKRGFLEIEELNIGNGPVAAWGRRLKAEIEVKYSDGTAVYKGPVITYVGFRFNLENGLIDPNLLPWTQEGIQLGLNGMAVGGRRRFTVDRGMVCTQLKMGAPPEANCVLVYLTHGPGWSRSPHVRKEKIIVEAELTESCIPLSFRAIQAGGSYLIYKQIGCRDSKEPVLNPKAPIWTVY